MWLASTALLSAVVEREEPAARSGAIFLLLPFVLVVLPCLQTGVCGAQVIFVQDIILGLPFLRGEDEVVLDNGVFVQNERMRGVRGRYPGY